MIVAGSLFLLIVAGASSLFAAALLHRAALRGRALSILVGLALLMAATGLLTRVTANLLLSAAIAAALFALGTRALWHDAPPAPIEGPVRPHAWAYAIAFAGLFLTCWTAVAGYFWDEHSGHFGLSNVLANGVVPPEHPLFPGEPFRYHYGFDLLTGLVRAATGVPVEHAIDVVSIGLYLLLLGIAAEIGGVLGGRAGASLAMVLAPLGAGALQVFLFRDFGALELHWSAIPEKWSDSQPPPPISNFFQHPMAFGMPLSLAVMRLFAGSEDDALVRARRVMLGSVILGTLSLAHLVYFSVSGLALGVSVLAAQRDLRLKAWELARMAVSVPIAFALGGFFERGPKPEGGDRLFHLFTPFFADPPLARIVHHLVVFGLPFLALFAAPLFLRGRARGLRVAIFAASIAGFLVPNVVTYGRSWDVVKFFGAGAFYANLVLAGVLAAWIGRSVPASEARSERSERRAAGRTCSAADRLGLALALVVSTNTAWFWLLRCSVLDGRFGISRMHFAPPPKIAREVGKRLLPMMDARDRVLSTNIDMSQGAGLLTPGFDWRAFGESYMMDRRRADRFSLALNAARQHLRREDLEVLGVRWAVLSPGDVESLSEEGRAALRDPFRFEHVFDAAAEDGVRHVYRVVRDP